jgi:hypothetical protein
MLRLNISQQYAQTSLDIKKPQINLDIKAPAIQLQTDQGSFAAHYEKGELQIDQTQFRYSIGIKTNSELTRDFAQEAMQAVLQGIARMSREGDRLASIGTEPDALQNILAEHSQESVPDVTWASTSPPEIRYTPKPVQVDFEHSDVEVTLDRGTVGNNFDWGKVNVAIGQYNSIRFWVTGNKWDVNV